MAFRILPHAHPPPLAYILVLVSHTLYIISSTTDMSQASATNVTSYSAAAKTAKIPVFNFDLLISNTSESGTHVLVNSVQRM